jgi:hypothetical protein
MDNRIAPDPAPEGTAARPIAPAIMAAQAMMVEAQVARLLPMLHSYGIKALLLKGPSHERWLYGPGEPRPACDVDILVAPAQYPLTERALKDLGFINRYDGLAPVWAEEHADTWVSRRWDLPVDLHRCLWGFSAAPDRVWQTLWASREIVDIGGVPVDVLREPARALITALHVAHHGTWVAKPLLDLRRAIERAPTSAWEQATALARDLGAAGGLVAGLTVVPEGERLRQQLGLAEIRPHMPHVQPRMWFVPPTTEGFVRLAEATGPVAKAKFLWHELVPSAEFMRNRSSEASLARRGRRGLAASYAVRWVGLLRPALTGMSAARRLRRE